MKDKIDIYSFIYQNKNTAYVKKLFDLYKRDMRIKEDVSISEYKDLNWFVDWIKYNREMSEVFANNINGEFILPNEVIEIGKGFLDTDAFGLKNAGLNVTSVSRYADDIRGDINKVRGILRYDIGEGIICSSVGFKNLSSVDGHTLITTLPVSEDELNSMIKCLDLGYDCLFGFYSDMDYRSYNDKIKRFKALKETIQRNTDLKTQNYSDSYGAHAYNALYVKGRRK